MPRAILRRKSLLVGFSALVATVAATAVLPAEELLPEETPIEQAVDHYIDLRLAELGISPAPPAEDANLLRRTMLDLTGRPATMFEAQQHLASSDPARRTSLVDRLLASPGFVRHQAAELNDLLGGDDKLERYLQTAVEQNRPWSEMFRDLMIGDPADVQQDGAIRFVKTRANDLDKLTNDASVVFFGINVSCAKCHDHPLVADWSQDHYYGMYAFFSRTFENGDFAGERDYGQVEFKTTSGETRPAKPMFLTGFAPQEPQEMQPTDDQRRQEKERLEELKKNKQPPPPPAFSRRRQLVETALAEKEKQFFARAMVNRLWKRFFGIGLVHPVDQMHSENRPSHPQLLDWLARDFANNGYDLKRLTRGLVLSRTYARSSAAVGEARPLANSFAVAAVRPLTPRQYAISLRLASTAPGRLSNDAEALAAASPGGDRRIADLANGSRELARRFEAVGDEFQVGAAEALFLSNSQQVGNELLAPGEQSIVGFLESLEDNRKVSEMAIWAILARPPQEQEITALTQYLDARPNDRAGAIKQMAWALLASSELRFNY